MSSSNEKDVLLKSSDGKSFLVNGVTIAVSDTIRNVMEDTCICEGIPLPNVRGVILEKVIQYCEKYSEESEQQNWPGEYAKLNEPLLLDILFAADYLNIRSLQDLMCFAISKLVAGDPGRDPYCLEHLGDGGCGGGDGGGDGDGGGSGGDDGGGSGGGGSSSANEKMVLRKSSDGKSFLVEGVTIAVSNTIRNVIEDTCIDDGIPVPVRGMVLEKVIRYCEKYHEQQKRKYHEQQNWPGAYAKVNEPLLLDILFASDYLNISSLQEFMCLTISNLVSGKTREEIFAALNIKENLDSEEEAHLQRTLTRLGYVFQSGDWMTGR
ncbi:uncharacterized protein LOC113325101 [Papaver somniferum]|uniref:uncharacterized protein LOC113325101 n=1 Tax=Papaver somniferum TaxID=3469 RepID=UPI000E6FD76F|nr:uncharacterized protein LOC113325101 [Papaver somniferum]